MKKRNKFEIFELDGKKYRATPKKVNEFWKLRENMGGSTPQEALAQLTDLEIAKKLRISIDTLCAIEFGKKPLEQLDFAFAKFEAEKEKKQFAKKGYSDCEVREHPDGTFSIWGRRG